MSHELPEITVAVVPKNSSEEIRVRLNEYRGSRFVDLRVFTAFGEDPERKPTKKGVALKVEMLDELMDALAKAKAEAVRQGLLEDGGAA